MISRLARKHSTWVVGVLGLAVAIVALYVELNPGDNSVSPEQQELLSDIPPKVGWHCHKLEDLGPELPAFTDRIQARAECKSTDPGPEEVTFSSFVTPADQQRYVQAYAAHQFRMGFACDADYLPLGRWVDRSGRGRGEVLCADGPQHANLVWSETSGSLPIVGYATAKLADEEQLHRWWQRDVKYDGSGPTASAIIRLKRELPGGFGSCTPAKVVRAGAVASVECRPGGGVTSAGAALFADADSLKRYLATEARSFPQASRTEGCGVSPLSYSGWWLGGDRRRPEGKLLCYPFDGTEWIVWSTLGAHVYAYASRADGRTHALWSRWSQSLSQIGPAAQTKNVGFVRPSPGPSDVGGEKMHVFIEPKVGKVEGLPASPAKSAPGLG